MTDFIEYLHATVQAKAGGKPLFEPGIYNEGAKKTWTALPSPRVVTDAELLNCEERLGIKLPDGYRAFMQTIGPGIWALAGVAHPDHLYAFDADCGEMEGYIALAFNVDGCGNSIGISPKSEDQSIYYFCHDPFGYAVTALSFEDWVKAIADCQIKNPTNGTELYYDSVGRFTEVKLPGSPDKKADGKPWWQFW
jgi:hypothetical protein